MTALPTSGVFSDASTTNAVAKQAQDDIIAYLLGLLGSTGVVSDARAALGFSAPILDRAAPGDIGGTTPGAVSATTLTTSGNATIGGATATQSNSNAAGLVLAEVLNTSTAAGSGAEMRVSVNGASAGDPRILIQVAGVTGYYVGIDNDAADALKISSSAGIGTVDHVVLSSGGLFGVGATPATQQLLVQGGANIVGEFLASSSSYANDALRVLSNTTGGTGWNLLRMVSDYSGTTDAEFVFRGDGNAFADGSFSGGGADFAEFFEWADGNPGGDDRVGVSVVLDGEKIRPALDGEEPIGVVSGAATVVGDADIDRWRGKYLRDDFGRYLREPYQVIRWSELVEVRPRTVVQIPAELDQDGNEVSPAQEVVLEAKHREDERSYHLDRIPAGIVPPDNAEIVSLDDAGYQLTRRALNPAYDPTYAYVPRADRPEWDVVGLVGKVRVRVGQPTGSRWIRMRAISAEVEEWLVR